MKVLIATSNNYSFLIEPYYTLFNKYFPGQELVFLGFDKGPESDLPENCSFVSLGKQSDFGSIWTDPLIPYIDSLEDEYFIFTVEDVMLLDHVDIKKFKILEDEIKNNRASKAILDSHLNKYSEPYQFTTWESMWDDSKNNLRLLHQNAPYRTTLHPSIWRKEYFRKYLKPGFTAWQFETSDINVRESNIDGANIISLAQEKDLYYTCNVFLKGVPFPRFTANRPYGTSTDKVSDKAMEDIRYIQTFIEKKGPHNENKDEPENEVPSWSFTF